jgi:MFS superfamily sulfate permease-like transporter
LGDIKGEPSCTHITSIRNISMNSTPDTTSNTKKSIVKGDILASIVVFLVALPLCMGIAIASGAPVAAGLITGIVGGLVVGALAGCPLQVSGPAAGLTVIVYDIIQQHGLEMLGLGVLLAGVIQMIAGAVRLGQWFRAVSPAVIQGMLAGIGFLILASQFHVMIDDKPRGSGAENLASIPAAIVKAARIPRPLPREVREVHTEMIRSVGELHRQQVSIKEQLAEHLPHNGGQEPVAVSENIAADVKSLVTEEQALVENFAVLEKNLVEFEQKAPESEKAERIIKAAQVTLASGRIAIASLADKDLQAAFAAQNDFLKSLEGLMGSMKNHNYAAGIGILTILLIVFWQGFAPKSLKVLPAPLVAVFTVTIITTMLVVPVFYVEVPDNLASDIHLPSLELLSNAPWMDLLKVALLLAAVASAETLLCCTAVDQMKPDQRTAYDRELFAQGIGNTVCGLVGALPMTGVIVRSSANIQAGGQTRLSAILHGLWLLVFVVALGFLLRLIPTSSLAAMLVYTGYKLVNVKAMAQLLKFGWGEVVIYAVTVIMIVFTDLLTGVIAGILLSALKLLYTFSHLQIQLKLPEQGNEMAVLKLHGSATFLRLPKLAAVLEQVPEGTDLQVDFRHLDYIDHACLDLLMNWAKQHESTNGALEIDWESLHARVKPDKLPEESTIMPSTNRGAARELVAK